MSNLLKKWANLDFKRVWRPLSERIYAELFTSSSYKKIPISHRQSEDLYAVSTLWALFSAEGQPNLVSKINGPIQGAAYSHSQFHPDHKNSKQRNSYPQGEVIPFPKQPNSDPHKPMSLGTTSYFFIHLIEMIQGSRQRLLRYLGERAYSHFAKRQRKSRSSKGAIIDRRAE